MADENELRLRDVLELNEEMARLNRRLNEFTQIVSHDLRAPLRHIDALTTFLREEADGPLPEAVERRVAQIEERVSAMASLIADLLEYARSGTLRTETQSFDFQAMATDTVDLVANRAGIGVSIQGDVGMVTTHRVPLAACIRNLVDNAVKHHPGPEGKVTIRAWRQGDILMVTVADDGTGIDPIHHERIFEPMQSLGGGSGLGLSTIRKILAEHGGSIALDSELGRGSAFTISWPLQPVPNRADAGAGTDAGAMAMNGTSVAASEAGGQPE